MKLVIVRPLDESASSYQLGQLLSKVAEGTDYRFVIIPGRIDFEMSTKEALLRMVDSIPD